MEDPGDLQEARPEEELQRREASLSSRWISALLFFGAGLASVIVVVVCVVVTTDSKNDTTDTTPDSSNDVSATSNSTASTTSYLSGTTIPIVANTSLGLQERILRLLPEYTLDAMGMGNSTTKKSPQYQAFEWMVQDPNLNIYFTDNQPTPHWRIYQRFALATLYFSTNGDKWNHNEHWLSYEHHECTWEYGKYYSMLDLVLTFSRPIPYYMDIEHTNACEWSNITTTGAWVHADIGIPLVANNNTVKADDATDKQTTSEDGIIKHFWMFKNNLDGTIPEELYWLTTLQTMALFDESKLVGTISTRIGDLSSDTFRYLHYGYTGLSGTIPEELGKFTNMAELILMSCDFTGTIPESLGTWPMSLSSQSNFLRSTNSSSQSNRTSRMEILQLDSNRLTGTIPTGLFQMTHMYMLYLYSNAFTGTIPSQLGNLKRLYEIFVDANQLSGSVSKLSLFELEMQSFVPQLTLYFLCL